MDGAKTAYGENSRGGAMSDEQRNHEDTEVEAHSRRAVNDEPAEAETDDEADDEVEAHVRKANVRMDSPKKF
jgi:hypothetical protein